MLFIHAILREEIIISRKFYYYLFLNNYYPVVHSYSYLHPQGGTVYLLQIPLTPLTQRCRPFIIYVEWVSTNGDREFVIMQCKSWLASFIALTCRFVIRLLPSRCTYLHLFLQNESFALQDPENSSQPPYSRIWH